MRDYGVSVLEQYPIEVISVRRVRGAVLCETDQGLMLLKEAGMRETRLSFLVELYQHLQEAGMEKVDSFVKDKEGNYIVTAEDETKYVLKRWFQGKECDVYKENELLECVHTLGRLHKMMLMEKEDGAYGKNERTLLEEYERHNRELRKVQSYIKHKSVKGSFEREFMKGYENMYGWARLAADRLECSTYCELEQEVQTKGTVIHGEYNYHNLLMGSDGIAVTGFERAHYGIQLEDLYYFMRKILEKHRYDERLGYRMMRAYDDEITLGKEKREYLAIRFTYPEKFWKISNMYYHSNKAWVPEKSTEKLKNAIYQTEEKKRFLANIFALNV